MREYRHLYESYGTVAGLSKAIRSKYESLRRNVLPHLAGRILEVGSGQGELLQLCAAYGLDARGCDISGEMVAACQARGLAVHLVTDTVAYLGACPAWDTLVLIDVLEHLTRDEAVELARLAAKRGRRIVVQVPNMASPFATLNLYHDLTHEWAYTESSITQLLRLAGFGHVKVLPVEHPSAGLGWLRTGLRRIFYACIWAILVVDQPNRSRILTPNLLAVADKSPREG